jgi:SEC-C motif domain protein
MNKLCPCKSTKLYKDCCEKYHLGKVAENALILMRSRFSAYALGLSDYIIKTSHPKNPCFKQDLNSLRKEIINFCKTTSFENLEILKFEEKKDHAFVTFIAYLKSLDKDLTFTEISHFEKVNGIWLYKDGKVFEGVKKDINH